ncbi:hypothetical protein SERLA73DRAFT_93326 [Serpula lacrymans var. lacrymans S7.3]|uniref:Serine/threonine-protein kinase Tel1 n=1 Tax=Serpula lacrymans var. lacrymans (strain S7.3) TaxID=936435 RepID=F8Q3P6_SERL3|nr:hypothetical protein SERLA73DRAFT_93326 [Serpula lacrymans var. lacrymans S7.3]
MNNLKTVLQQLKSEKIKERQDGISALRTVFSRDQAVLNLDESGDGRAWLVVFQALFTAVINEKAICMKKAASGKAGTTGATALRRLGDAAATVRWLTERSVHLLNKKVVKALLAHLLQVMVNKGSLYTQVALDYLKAIKSALSWTPHMDHLDEDNWLKITEMAFNVILGDPVRKGINENEDDDSTEKMEVDDSMYQDPEYEDDEDEEGYLPSRSTPSTQVRKRRRKEESATPGPSLSRSTFNSKATGSMVVSLEQIECTSLLVILLRSPSAPLLSSNNPHLSSSILIRLRRFLDYYPADTSLHHDYILALQAVLSHLALNRKNDVEIFTRGAWDGLVNLWGTKNKRMKESLVGVLRVLFPFLTVSKRGSDYSWADGVGRLWHLLNGEAESRWGIESLSLEALRLEVVAFEDEEICEREAFVAHTFRAGWHFDANQALAWAVLELQADCAQLLFQHSESVHTGTPGSGVDGKRLKREDPITSLLHSIRSNSAFNIRSYHLQILLFFIDRHWCRLHDSLQEDVVTVLLQLISFENAQIQSWAFMCIAAIAHSDGVSYLSRALPSHGTTVQPASSRGPTTWDPIWTHAMRRANVPVVCRAACHTANTLICHAKRLLTSHRVLLEIEALAKDLDVQGPPFPYDSVCIFLAGCLRVASQDVRLYRMQLEEKVLSWLLENWRVGPAHSSREGDRKSQMPLHTVGDIMNLLENVCGSSNRSDLVCRVLLPECSVVDVMVDERKTRVIKDFLLYARLPRFRRAAETPVEPEFNVTHSRMAYHVGTDKELDQPTSRERKVSSAMLKFLESLAAEWELIKEVNANPTAEKARQSLDIAIIAIVFESLLVWNGTRSNRRVLQCAGKVITLVAPFLTSTRWTVEERALILHALEPLILSGEEDSGDDEWDFMLTPNIGTGIKAQVLSALNSHTEQSKQVFAKRRDFQRVVWQNMEVRPLFLPHVLRNSVNEGRSDSNPSHLTDIDDKDDFGPIRTSLSTLQSSSTDRPVDGSSSSTYVIDLCMTFLAVTPVLQASSGEPTRDKELTGLILDCPEDKFLLLGPAYFNQARRRLLSIGVHVFDQILDKFGAMLPLYGYSRNEKLQLLAVHFLHSTLHVWLQTSFTETEVGEHVRDLCAWISRMIQSNKAHSWRMRDAVSRFMTTYMIQDPSHYEYMLTRMLTLGNIMIISSAVRRGPYWHLLEAAFHSPHYALHIQSILSGVSERLGLTCPSQLFEAYASQIAYSIRQALQDILRLPPHLLGYKNRKECAEATFRAFTPTNMIAGGPDMEAIVHGQRLFANHCAAVQNSPIEGTRTCLGDLVGFQLVYWLDEDVGEVGGSSHSLEELLQSKGVPLDALGGFDECLTRNVDSIVAAVLRTLGDQDFSPNGAIIQGLRSSGESDKAILVFQKVNQYRTLGDFDVHNPNLPTFATITILRALRWLTSKIANHNRKATTFHVLHQLFADIQHTPLVNEQIRLLNGISILVSVWHDCFEDSVLLHTLIHQATSLLAQTDLTQVARSYLEWAFGLYRQTTEIDHHFPDVLISVCAIAYDYAANTRDTSIMELGNDLLRWIDEQALKLCRPAKTKSQVLKAIPAWPHQPSSELMSIYEDITSEKLSAILSDYRITSNKFRLVRRLRDVSIEQKYDTIRFATVDFWRLKECIPSKVHLRNDDVDAFASLLIQNSGDISSFDREQSYPQSVRGRHRRGGRRRVALGDASPQQSIVQSLLAMLDSTSSTQVNMSYRTLRSLMSVSSEELFLQAWSFENRAPLEYLQQYPVVPKTRPVRSVEELQNWDIQLGVEFSQWISMITILLCDVLASDNPFYAQFSHILQSDITLAEDMLPVLTHTLLQGDLSTKASFDTPSGNRNKLSEYMSVILQADDSHVSCLRCIVDVILHLRHFRPNNTTDALAHDKWLGVDYGILARSAVTCGAYTTALLFLELSLEYQVSTNDSLHAEHILFEIYSHIDEPDGFYGIQTPDLREFLIKRFHHEKQWEKAFRFHGAALEADRSESSDTEGLLRAFHAFGFNNLAIGALQNSHFGFDSEMGSYAMSYRLGWRTETWDLPDKRDADSGISLYRALRAIYRERNPQTIDTILQQAQRDEMERLRILGTENMMEIREVTQNLMCLGQISRWRSRPIQDRLQKQNTAVSEWSDFVHLEAEFDFADLESIMATRMSLVRSVRQREEREQIGNLLTPFIRTLVDIEKTCLVHLSQAARGSKQLQIALNAIIKAQRLEKFPTPEVSQEFANVLWDQNEQKLAVQFLKEAINHATSENAIIDMESNKKKALLLSRLGSWTSEACLEKPTDIMANFFHPATELAVEVEQRANSSDSACANVYRQCAIFADQQYHAIFNSPDAVRWKIYMDRKLQEISSYESQLQSLVKGTNEFNRRERERKKAQTLFDTDQHLYQQHSEAQNSFLEQALDMYSRCLASSDEFDDDSPIRLCTLWFANFENQPLQDKVQVALGRVPSRKFVFLAHQLSARISNLHAPDLPKNQQNLQDLVLRMCQEHPFHSLYQVYSLRPEQPVVGIRSSSRHEPSPSQTGRAAAADDIFDRLRNDAIHGSRVRAVEQVCAVSVQWAKHPVGSDIRAKKVKPPHEVHKRLLIRGIRDIQVPVMTRAIPLDATLRYDNCVWISHYDTTFTTAGGINMPKIIFCHGSDGEKYRQLFKGEGEDDLRQDAVMEQVFSLVNVVLKFDRETRRRALSVRGYMVIPLGAQAGVLEFVGNTTPLRLWLEAAHIRYRPGDYKYSEAGGMLAMERKKYPEQEKPLIAMYKHIRERCKPVMRHYFTEKHKDPNSWFAMRLKYVRSVATTSIVGHILGLGDRHISNILIDNGTGEVVHIDLGIAFDQGKLLQVPERVPFRMTRDMVDGMGMSGTQGVFQRCAEETLRVLRDRSDVIMTVLEVFKYDPLHSWTASEFKIKKVQGSSNEHITRDNHTRLGIGIDMTSGSADEAADRALSSVSRKLDRSLSVEYTVNALIAEATDIVNLATIFHGWSPHF